MNGHRKVVGTAVESCGASVEAHFILSLRAVNEAGTGVMCPEAYQALAELAEAYRIIGGFAPHVPSETSIGTKLGRDYRRERELEDPIDGVVISHGYADMLPADQKKFH